MLVMLPFRYTIVLLTLFLLDSAKMHIVQSGISPAIVMSVISRVLMSFNASESNDLTLFILFLSELLFLDGLTSFMLPLESMTTASYSPE